MSEQRWQEAITLNFHRPRQLAGHLLDSMIERGWGRIINITGKSEPEHVNGAFCAKAGLHSWAKGLSRMVGKHGITVNCVPPGRIHSEQILRNYTPECRQWQADNEIPAGRYGEPEDIRPVCRLSARISAPASCARSRWEPSSASVPCRTCPRWPRWATRISRPRGPHGALRAAHARIRINR